MHMNKGITSVITLGKWGEKWGPLRPKLHIAINANLADIDIATQDPNELAWVEPVLILSNGIIDRLENPVRRLKSFRHEIKGLQNINRSKSIITH